MIGLRWQDIVLHGVFYDRQFARHCYFSKINVLVCIWTIDYFGFLHYSYDIIFWYKIIYLTIYNDYNFTYTIKYLDFIIF
jgi:hypothetical protein